MTTAAPGSRESRIEFARRGLVDALVAQGADRPYAVGYVAERVSLTTTFKFGHVVSEMEGRIAPAETPEQLAALAASLQADDPAALLSGSPATPPARTSPARARHSSIDVQSAF